jgi:tartrate-resistant acid phosphatase type 5
LVRDSVRRRPATWGIALLAAAVLLCSGCSGGGSQARLSASANHEAPPASRGPSETAPAGSAETGTPVVFAVIGDYGTGDAHERAVARRVSAWQPRFVLALGDDYYASAGGKGTGKYDNSTGKFYGAWLKDVRGTAADRSVARATLNGFFPAMGNHDYSEATPSPETYLTYFTLPGAGFANTSGNERYYDFVEGPVHFFVLNSNQQEPDGTGRDSKQARWLRSQLAASTSRWNVVYDHYPPYSSDSVHGSSTQMRWPFAAWGADVVLSGHAHDYERIMRDGIVYFVNGLGGASRRGFGTPVAGSTVRYKADWGAQRCTATDDALKFEFYTVHGGLIDSYVLTAR